MSATAAQMRVTVRSVAASFLAGAAAMLCLGVAGPIISQGALSGGAALASTRVSERPVIEPLDVAAVRAQLAAAETTMAAARATTDDDIARLMRLTR
ncbi:MAG: hypothetical protein KF700_10340 [Hyphomonadaceae bacterium]|nr:hypothetical protein [Hyphomonadaceae bacterium]